MLFLRKNHTFATKYSETSRQMNVFVNDTPVKTYYGAKVKSAVMAYFRDNDIPLKTVVKEVRDSYGNRIAMDGAIRSNSRIYIKL